MLRYAITEGRSLVPSRQDREARLAAQCGELARGGVEFVLIREKELGAGAMTALSRRVVAAVGATGQGGEGTRVLVAGRADVAVAAGTDGVHLGSGWASGGEALRVPQARRVFRGAFVSVSCHSVDEVREAREEGADAVLFAPVFGKWVDGVNVVTGVGLERLGEACRAAGEMSVFALGGVTKANAAECVTAGAAGVAGIRMFFGDAEG